MGIKVYIEGYNICLLKKNIEKKINNKPNKLKKLFKEFKKKKINLQVHYIPIHLQPYYKKKYGFKKGDFPAAEKYYQTCLSIPIFPNLKKNEINHVINKINSIISIK